MSSNRYLTEIVAFGSAVVPFSARTTYSSCADMLGGQEIGTYTTSQPTGSSNCNVVQRAYRWPFALTISMALEEGVEASSLRMVTLPPTRMSIDLGQKFGSSKGSQL